MARGKVSRGLIIGLVVFLIGLVVYVNFSRSQNQSAVATPTPESIVGQLFVVGIPNETLDQNTRKFLTEIQPGGIVLYKQNISSEQRLEKLTTDLQQLALRTTGRKYLIMVDEEPGGASRLGLFQNVFALGQPDWVTIKNDIKTMNRLGINVDLAPVADFPFNEDSFIIRRMPAHTPDALVTLNKEFISLLQSNGVGATLKHFPGLGVFSDDPHSGIIYSGATTTVMNQSIDIFQKGINDGAAFVMTGHGVYDQLDPDVPATLSPKIVGLLREKLGFKGIIITDDLSDMPFIINKNISIPEATSDAIKAGHTMVIFSRRPELTRAAWQYLVNGYVSDPKMKKLVDANYELVVNYKDKT